MFLSNNKISFSEISLSCELTLKNKSFDFAAGKLIQQFDLEFSVVMVVIYTDQYIKR